MEGWSRGSKPIVLLAGAPENDAAGPEEADAAAVKADAEAAAAVEGEAEAAAAVEGEAEAAAAAAVENEAEAAAAVKAAAAAAVEAPEAVDDDSVRTQVEDAATKDCEEVVGDLSMAGLASDLKLLVTVAAK